MNERTDGGGDLPAAILDIDGTLVDTNYHHAVAWFRAFGASTSSTSTCSALAISPTAGRRPPTSRRPSPTWCRPRSSRPGVEPAVMVGDSTWDCEAAKRAGLETIAVLTGGFSEQELRSAGAVCVFDRLAELRANLASTPLSPV